MRMSVRILPRPVAFVVLCIAHGSMVETVRAQTDAGRRTRGPLRVHPENRRYFTDGTNDAAGGLKAVYLTGSHTWDNLQDSRERDAPATIFDYTAYLKFMREHGHNFMRMWMWEGGVN